MSPGRQFDIVLSGFLNVPSLGRGVSAQVLLFRHASWLGDPPEGDASCVFYMNITEYLAPGTCLRSRFAAFSSSAFRWLA